MSVADYQISIGGLLMGPTTGYVIHQIDGFGLPDVRSSDVDRPRDHGEFYGIDFLAGRIVTITATILGTSPSDAVAKLDALMDVWSPDSFGQDTSSTLPLSYQFPGQATRRFNGRPRRASADTSRIVGNRIPIVLEYKVADPRQYADSLQSASAGIVTATSGRSYPRSYPLAFGGSISAFISALNSGNIGTRPTAHIAGPANNPKVENVTAGAFVKCAIVLGATDYLDIDFDAKTILLNGTASRYSTMTSDSAWWELAPGTSTVRLTADTYQAAASLTLAWRSAWL